MSGLALEEYSLLGDSKYRAYVAAIDKALRNFEAATEWADLSSTLNKLHKVLAVHMTYKVVPRRIIISRRLAQCLHPTLPAGVHLKALEIYDIVFKCMGTDRLSQELFIYSAGLFPLFHCAAMNVRSALLTIYETHFVPLGQRLTPSLNGFLSGILSGLEEGSDHLDRTSVLLQRVAEGVGYCKFFGCLWECILNNSVVRFPALTHITSCFNKKFSTEDQLYILGDIDIMVHAICKALKDEFVLVQRAALDLIHILLPMHNTQLLKNDLTIIVSSSLLVLLRRDMSLNRRFFAWMLGTEVKLGHLPSEHPLIKKLSQEKSTNPHGHDGDNDILKYYFTTFSKVHVIKAFVNLVKSACTTLDPPDFRPCRIIIPLMDKSDIGSHILDVIFIDFLRYVYHMSEGLKRLEASKKYDSKNSSGQCAEKNSPAASEDSGKTIQDFNKTVLLVFSTLQPSYCWMRLTNLMEEAMDACKSRNLDEPWGVESGTLVAQPGQAKVAAREVAVLLQYLLSLIPLETNQQVSAAKLFNVLSCTTKLLTDHIQYLSPLELHSGLSLCRSILKKLIPSTVQPHNNESSELRSINSTICTIQPQSLSQYNVPVPAKNGVIQIGIEATQKTIDDFNLQSQILAKQRQAKKGKKKHNKSNIAIDIDPKESTDSSSYSSATSTTQSLDSDRSECRVLGQKISSVTTSSTSDLDVECSPQPPNPDQYEQVGQYVHEYLSLFGFYVQNRLSSTSSLNFQQFQTLLHSKENGQMNSSYLRDLLNQSVNCSNDRPSECLSEPDARKGHRHLQDVTPFKGVSSNEVDAFKVACKILIDLSSIPANESHHKATAHTDKSLPTWLLSLMLCICAGEKISVRFVHVAISTLLELVVLGQSDLSVWQLKLLEKTDSSHKGVTSVYMAPLLTSTHTHQLLHQTTIYQFIAMTLWNHLEPHLKEFHVPSTDLLLQLHSLSLPKPSIQYATSHDLSVVEKEIMKSFVSQPTDQSSVKNCEKVDSTNSAMVRWITLWQVSRSSTSPATFNRCLFLMVERLRCQFALERSYARNWLTESLYWGDLRRILDPILSFLLHPDTRRVSVQHVSIEKISDGDLSQAAHNQDLVESQIYAISSIGGEVMYHISKGHQTFHEKSNLNVQSIKKQILTYAGLSKDSNKCVTQKARVTDYEVPDYNNHFDSDCMSVMVNPFSTHPWIDFNDLTKMNPTINFSDAVKNARCIKTTNSKTVATTVATNIVHEIIDNVLTIKQKQKDQAALLARNETTLHPLHSHMLLYMQLVDSGQCLYGLNLIKHILEAEPKLFLLSLASTGITQNHSPTSLLTLMARHRKSVFGEGFDGGKIAEPLSQLRSAMYLQVVITVCLYFIRSYYPQQDHPPTQDNILQENRELQVVAAEVLCTLFSELTPLVADSPRGFSPYIKDLLNKCKVQKCVLHCLLSTALAMKECEIPASKKDKSFTQDVLEYNFNVGGSSKVLSQEQPYLFCLMDLTLSLIKLEDVLIPVKTEAQAKEPYESDPTLTSLRYVVGQPIAAQPMFLWAFLLALSQKSLRQFHTSWLHLFTSALPHMGHSLSENCLKIVSQLCKNLEEIPLCSENLTGAPSDYTIYLLTSLMNIVHFCLLDSNASSISNAVASSVNVSNFSSSSHTSGQILYNLLHVFSPSGEVLEASVDTSHIDPLLCARKNLLSHLPRLVSSVLALWISTGESAKAWSPCMGSKLAVRQRIVELLSPICHHHTPYLIAAVSVAWQGLRKEESSILNCVSLQEKNCIGKLWNNTKEQKALVQILATLKVLPLHFLIDNIKEVFKHPPTVEGMAQRVSLEVSTLQLFYLYVKETCSADQLAHCYSSFLSLIKEGLLFLPPSALLILLATLNEFVQRSPSSKEKNDSKKDIKEQQEVTSKLLDAVSSIAGSCLESTTWLRRNFTVKTEIETNLTNGQSANGSLSVAALTVLAELLAPLLDVLYPSDEKERVLPLLFNIMANVVPYLKNHTSGNMAAFHACSQLLASLSSYQYTLKAWRKDILELLLDTNAFKMFPETLCYWRVLVDNLCTHDKTVFKEILGKISISQGGTLNLFTNKESEYETCGALLKRLSFTIFCSDVDHHLHLIEERLTEVTRLSEIVPGLLAQELMCFRVLLLRMPPKEMSSLWPIIITELVQVLLMLEQELSTDTEQFKAHLKHLSTLDSRWVVGSYSGLHAHNNPAWLSLYLAACKLLDLMLALPTSYLPQFQMYRWAFVGTLETFEPPMPCKEKPMVTGSYLYDNSEFVPHIIRIAKLMAAKASKLRLPKIFPNSTHPAGHLLLKMNCIESLMDLHPFIVTLSSADSLRMTPDAPPSHSKSKLTESSERRLNLKHIEAVIEKDFVETLHE